VIASGAIGRHPAHPPSYPPSSPRDTAAEAYGVPAAELARIVRRAVQRASRGVEHDLDDAAQDALCRMLDDDRARFDGRRALVGFVALRARWTLADGRRRECRAGRLHARYLDEHVTTSPSPEDEAIAAEDAAARAALAADVARAVASLEPDARAVVMAHDLGGASLRVLAHQAGVNVSTLSRRRAAALAALETAVTLCGARHR
jgi:RNA polymerase sigma factor (sigma-70 family)